MGKSEQMCLDLSRLTEEVLQGSRWSEFQGWVCEKRFPKVGKPNCLHCAPSVHFYLMNLWDVCSARSSFSVGLPTYVAAPASFLTPRWTFRAALRASPRSLGFIESPPKFQTLIASKQSALDRSPGVEAQFFRSLVDPSADL